MDNAYFPYEYPSMYKSYWKLCMYVNEYQIYQQETNQQQTQQHKKMKRKNNRGGEKQQSKIKNQ